MAHTANGQGNNNLVCLGIFVVERRNGKHMKNVRLHARNTLSSPSKYPYAPQHSQPFLSCLITSATPLPDFTYLLTLHFPLNSCTHIRSTPIKIQYASSLSRAPLSLLSCSLRSRYWFSR
uniref:Uncharacterized protein n=1 Tax=Trypanosoma vivax (strain Y486) TaxID=1055687 RepID=G0TU40_TRYVY|nr:hypothetical protein, unlikely [Trypanosoma vivax Y486]